MLLPKRKRPGDLLDLADYWKSHGKFGSFAEMLEHSIARKLTERDPHRPDNETISPEDAREGAERLAAALTLGKSFTLRAPGHDPDPSLAAGALNPTDILPDWTDARRNALLRRGIFAPATYGRIRFHHRSTQEYLVTFGELRSTGLRNTLIYCSDYRCGHSVSISADRWGKKRKRFTANDLISNIGMPKR